MSPGANRPDSLVQRASVLVVACMLALASEAQAIPPSCECPPATLVTASPTIDHHHQLVLFLRVSGAPPAVHALVEADGCFTYRDGDLGPTAVPRFIAAKSTHLPVGPNGRVGFAPSEHRVVLRDDSGKLRLPAGRFRVRATFCLTDKPTKRTTWCSIDSNVFEVLEETKLAPLH